MILHTRTDSCVALCQRHPQTGVQHQVIKIQHNLIYNVHSNTTHNMLLAIRVLSPLLFYFAPSLSSHTSSSPPTQLRTGLLRGSPFIRTLNSPHCSLLHRCLELGSQWLPIVLADAPRTLHGRSLDTGHQ